MKSNALPLISRKSPTLCCHPMSPKGQVPSRPSTAECIAHSWSVLVAAPCARRPSLLIEVEQPSDIDFSAISMASLTSMPRYLAVLSDLECRSNSCTARVTPQGLKASAPLCSGHFTMDNQSGLTSAQFVHVEFEDLVQGKSRGCSLAIQRRSVHLQRIRPSVKSHES